MKTRVAVLVCALTLALAHTLLAQAEGPSGKNDATRSPVTHSYDADAMRVQGELRYRANCGRCHAAPRKFPPRMMATVLRHMRVRATIYRRRHEAGALRHDAVSESITEAGNDKNIQVLSYAWDGRRRKHPADRAASRRRAGPRHRCAGGQATAVIRSPENALRRLPSRLESRCFCE